ncbi:MAG: hypothetical protein ACOX69_10825 [Coriobacteriales bacterium]|jgi:pyruvate ferredoxin oxidoreductase alpha subunit
MTRKFLSGDEALAEGVRLARPDVISAYPITPQTVVVERLSEMVADRSLDADFIHVESEHSALSAAMGASVAGCRAFTATSSQGLLYMAELLSYVAGGGFPVVMMNADRATALPWNIYGDQRDSLGLLDQGWIQAYAKDAQEALDFVLMAYRIAEDKRVQTPFMINLDGFALTHTYETVDVPEQSQADAYLPPYQTENRFDFERPKSIGFSAGPATNDIFKFNEHAHMMNVLDVLPEAERDFAEIFGRRYTGALEPYRADDAEYVIVTLGTISGLVADVVDALRASGVKAGLVRLRYVRPFPDEQLVAALVGKKGVAVLEKDISFGYEGTVYSDVSSALYTAFSHGALAGTPPQTFSYVGGLGGRDITAEDIVSIFSTMVDGENPPSHSFLGMGVH